MALYPRIQILTRTLCGAETLKLWKVDQIYLGSFKMCYCRWVEKISWTYRSKNEVLRKVTKERNILHTIKRSEANWIGHILRRNWLLKYVVEGKIETRIEAMGRRGRRRKQVLDDLNPLTPNDPYSGRTAPLTSEVAFYVFIQQIWVLNILNMVYTLRFFPL